LSGTILLECLAIEALANHRLIDVGFKVVDILQPLLDNLGLRVLGRALLEVFVLIDTADKLGNDTSCIIGGLVPPQLFKRGVLAQHD
jgi:hypothetical protein